MTSRTLDFVVKRRRPRPTEALNVYWEFADARLGMYRERLASRRATKTDDPVLAAHRFTNTFRATDRVSQYLIKHVIYDRPDRNFDDEFARVILFKLFNKIETWEAIRRRVGEVSSTAVLDGTVHDAVDRLAHEGGLYNAAYIMPPPRHLTGPKALRHVALLGQLLQDDMPGHVEGAGSLGEVFRLLRDVPSFGPFLAFQYAIDLSYGPTLRHDEDQHVVAGPGALRGLRKCYDDFGDFEPHDVIRFTQSRMQDDLDRLGIDGLDLWGRSPKLIDLQNVFCEVDKYTRVARPDLGNGVPGSRIKQRYRPDRRPLTAWFPPKWGINQRVAAWRTSEVPAVPQAVAPTLF